MFFETQCKGSDQTRREPHWAPGKHFLNFSSLKWHILANFIILSDSSRPQMLWGLGNLPLLPPTSRRTWF